MRTRNSLLNIISGIGSQFFLFVFQFIVRTVFIHQLGASYLGISGLFTNILTLLSFAELGFGQAITFALYRPIAEQDYSKIIALMRLFKKIYRWMFFIVLFLGLSCMPFLDFFIKGPSDVENLELIYFLFVFSTAVSYLFSYKTTFLIANQKNYYASIIYVISTLILCLCQIVLLYTFPNYIIYLGLQILFTIIQNVLISKFVDRKFPFLLNMGTYSLDKKEKKEIIKDVKALAIYKIGTISLSSTSNIFISKFVGILQVGYYSNYNLLVYSLSTIINTFFSNITASIGNLNATEGKEKQIKMFFNIHLASFWFYGIAFIFLYFCMTPFIKVWIGDRFILSNSVSFIIAFNLFIGGMLFASYNFRQTLGLFVQGQIRPIISAFLNIILGIILGKKFGIAGVLWAIAITRITTNFWYDPYIVFKKGFGISSSIYFVDLLRKLIVLFIAFFVVSFIVKFIPEGNFFMFLLRAFVTFVILNLVFALFYYKTSEFKYLLGIVLNVRNILKNK